MRTTAFTRLMRQVAELSKVQRAQLLETLRPAVGLDRVCEIIEKAKSAQCRCPDCGEARPYRHGQVHGLQRYRCRACGRTFSALTARRWRACATARRGSRIGSPEHLRRAAIGCFHTKR